MSALRNDLVLLDPRTPGPAADVPCTREANARRLWLTRHAQSDASRLAYEAALRCFLSSCGAESVQAACCSYETASASLAAFCASLAHLSPATQRQRLSAVRRLLSLCEKERVFDHPVSHLIVLPRLPVSMPEKVPDQETCLRCIVLEPEHRNRLMLKVLYYCGLRNAELVNLRWENVQYLRNADGSSEMALWVLGKGSKARWVDVRLELAAEIEEWRTLIEGEDHERVFGLRTTSGLFRICAAAWARVGVVAGRAGAGVHLWRHAHATHSQENGADRDKAQRTLGHARPETTEQYSHLAPQGSGKYLTWA